LLLQILEIKHFQGPGKYDDKTKTLSFEARDVKPQETRAFTITGKIASSNSLPNGQGITCVTNQAQATTDATTQADTAQLCIEKQVLGAKTPTTKGGLKVFPAPKPVKTPATGAEAIALFGIIPSALTGLLIRKKAIN
jgi:hypothetical protein